MLRVAFTMFAAALSPIAVLGGAEECDENFDEHPKGAILLQHKKLNLQHVEAFAWSASPFGSCLRGCTAGPLQTRRVECRSVYDNLPVPSNACTRPKPTAVAATCDCELQLCQNVSTSQDCPPWNGTDVTDWKINTGGYTTVGCFPAPSAALTEMAYDRTCEKWNNTGLCLSGLPFYFGKEAGTDEGKCYKFCMQKGLDIFGIQGSAVCRCGASLLNENVWLNSPPRPGLAFNPRALVQSTEDPCPSNCTGMQATMKTEELPVSIWTSKNKTCSTWTVL